MIAYGFTVLFTLSTEYCVIESLVDRPGGAKLGAVTERTAGVKFAQVRRAGKARAVVGRRGRHIAEDRVDEHLLGYTVLNDVSVCDWQGRTSEWFQGKNWDRMTPFGPVIVSPDELDIAGGLAMTCTVDGEVRQQGTTANMVFTPAQVVSYISTLCRPYFWLCAGMRLPTNLLAGSLALTGDSCQPQPVCSTHACALPQRPCVA